MNHRAQTRTKPTIRPVVITGGASVDDAALLGASYAYRDEVDGGYHEAGDLTPVALADIELHESTRRVCAAEDRALARAKAVAARPAAPTPKAKRETKQRPTRVQRRARGERGFYPAKPPVSGFELRATRALMFAAIAYTWDPEKVDRLNADGKVVAQRRLLDEKIGTVTVFGVRLSRQQIEQAAA